MLFQSAPLTGARGDAIAGVRQAVAQFQSAPLTGARGDVHAHGHPLGVDAVSIRSPDRSQGRRLRKYTIGSARIVSIRSPDRSQGRPPVAEDKVTVFIVSIRSPDRSQGRRMAAVRTRSASPFQSAPLTGARGDAWGWESESESEFQSAPLTGARGDLDPDDLEGILL